MLKLTRTITIVCLALFSASLYAESMIVCPQSIRCYGSKCHMPSGFSGWKIYAPFDKYTGRFIFSQAVYTQYQNVVTLTCRYGNGKGPSLILDNATSYKPLQIPYAQWIKRDENRTVCNAAFPKHCSFYAE